MKPRHESLLFLNIAVLMWGITVQFAKLIDLPALPITAIRSGFAAITLWIYLRWTQTDYQIHRRRDLPHILMLGLCLAGHWGTFFHSIQLSTVAIGILSLHTYPVMTAILEPFVFGERFRMADLWTALAVFVGLLILMPEYRLDGPMTRGVLWGVLSGVFFTLRNLFSRRAIRHYSGATLMMWQTAIAFLVLTPFIPMDDPRLTGGAFAKMLVLGAVFTALPHTLYTLSMKNLSAKTAGVIATCLPVYGTVFAFFLLGEVPATRTLLGGAVVLIAVAAEAIIASKDHPPPVDLTD